jgi:aryl-alcohol dehydrogenase-like predicted oxidoreductase
MSKIALGTAQFGLPYGIANQQGQVSMQEIAAILHHAWASGVRILDTAISYGNSESRLGQIGVSDWQVVSKLPALPTNCLNVGAWVDAEITASLKRLQVTQLYGLLLHRPANLLESQGQDLYQALTALKTEGRVKKIGVSIYAPSELEAILASHIIDLIQVPFNVLDRRLQTSGWLDYLHQTGVEVHTRSAFLQGLLLMDKAKRPQKFELWSDLWLRWQTWLDSENLTPLQAALGFVQSQPKVDRVVVGVDNCRQLQEIIDVAQLSALHPPSDLSTSCEDLINPSRWSRL